MGMIFKEDRDDYAYDYDYTWERSQISKFGAEDDGEDLRIQKGGNDNEQL